MSLRSKRQRREKGKTEGARCSGSPSRIWDGRLPVPLQTPRWTWKPGGGRRRWMQSALGNNDLDVLIMPYDAKEGDVLVTLQYRRHTEGKHRPMARA